MPFRAESTVPSCLDLAAIGVCFQMLYGCIGFVGGPFDSHFKGRYLRGGA